MESNEEFKTDLNQQFLMKIKACVIYLSSQSATLPIEPLLEAIKITIPHFDEKKIDIYFLTNEEAKLINNLAVFYSEQGDIEKAIIIFKNLKKSIEKSYKISSEKPSLYSMVLYNLSKNLGLHRYFSEAIEICDVGQDFCVKNDMLRYLPLLIFNKAYCLYELNQKDESKKIIFQAYYGSIMSNQYDIAKIIQEYSRTFLDISFYSG